MRVMDTVYQLHIGSAASASILAEAISAAGCRAALNIVTSLFAEEVFGGPGGLASQCRKAP